MNLTSTDNRKPPYTDTFPHKQVPGMLVTHSDGSKFTLFESHAMLRYIHTVYALPDHWYPIDAKKRAKVE